MAQTIAIDEQVTVGTLAESLMIPVSRLITELMKNGIMATVNERIDFDTAQIMVAELGLEVELTKKSASQPIIPHDKKTVLSDQAVARPPVVAVMGHVDHGKTSLLDAIRGAEIAKGEAGGITQHISAYQITHGTRAITFLDTPGHEAFAAIRAHGAELTDLVVIVVAADDGVKPQTIEAIRFARQAGVKIIVAINKIDKPGADANRVKQELSAQDLLVEEWGGDIVALEVSAKTKQGIDQLLDMILLVADVEDLRAETDGPARGLIIEAHIERGRGPVAHALISSGTLHLGDYLVAGHTYGRVRNLEDSDGSPILHATPSTPVQISSFKSLPQFTDEFIVTADEKTARLLAEQAGASQQNTAHVDMDSGGLLSLIDRSNQVQLLNVIVKADVQGSLISVVDSLKSLETNEVAVRLVTSGVGPINESDVHLAHTSNAILYGFHVTVAPSVRQTASRDKVHIRLYSIIYELIDDAKAELSALLAPEVKESILGTLVIKGVFKTTKTEVICGGEVTSGKLSAPALVRVTRSKEQIAEAEMTNLKRGPQDATEVITGELCGLSLRTTGHLDLQEGDVITVFKRELIARQL